LDGNFHAVHPYEAHMFWNQNCKFCDIACYTFDMKVYTEKDKGRADQEVTATQAMLWDLCKSIVGTGYALYIDNLFLSPMT
jgi:hypothetical protein